MNIFAHVDTSGLTQAINVRSKLMSSKRTMRQIVCTAAHEIAIGAAQRMPYVETSTIDSELNVWYSLGKTAKGKASKAKRNMIANTGKVRLGAGGMGGVINRVPLAALIINAQVMGVRSGKSSQPGMSRYNQLTHMRYARPYSPFAGVSRRQGREAMRAAVNRMIRARHSSTHFLQSGWNYAINALAGETANRGRRRMVGFKTKRASSQTMGEVTIRSDAHSAWVYVANEAGAQSLNATSFNEALWRHGQPGLQASIAEEEGKMWEYVKRELYKIHVAAGLTS
jgi:hypothetical protein